MPAPSPISRYLPGLSLCAAVALLAYAGDLVEQRVFGRSILEALVLAILFGAAGRSFCAPPRSCQPGIAVSAKGLLEGAVVLLGLSLGAAALFAAGPLLIGGIAAIVITAIAISYGIGRMVGLPHKMAVLIACGNSICGNSAIAATAPVINANSDDVAASIAFTAVLGVVVVLALPLVSLILHLSQTQYGIFAGLTVYAVPQVIAATAPVGATSVQVGTLVKLVRVMMLGPVLVLLSMMSRRENHRDRPSAPEMRKLIPPFIVGFLIMVGVRSTGLVPACVIGWASAVASGLTVMAMAALGLCVDVRTIVGAGPRVAVVVVLSLFALGGISLAMVLLLGVR